MNQRNIFKTVWRKVCSFIQTSLLLAILPFQIFHFTIHVSSTNVPPSFGIIKRHTGVILLGKIIPLQNFLVRGMHNRDTAPINDETRWNFSTLVLPFSSFSSSISQFSQFLTVIDIFNEFLWSLKWSSNYAYSEKGKEIIVLSIFHIFTLKAALI